MTRKEKMINVQFEEKVFIWQNKTAWHFVSVPPAISEEIDHVCAGLKAGWGSIPVQAQIGQTTWQTSIFPDHKQGVYLLPLKALVRSREDIKEGSVISVSLSI